ncbi:nuclear pore complex protein NUP133 isoform X2 [Eucalyptus grandis]|uniref:nuclear pore complex protein NUP133 isoform X2 n=1 Tax=Eucalyptus grandis TaxID=71139 RepID=UPI00192ED533|nr:nuclear pore complex protein NUP133 isoform X2 [Eucalyptus grandis]
MFSPGTKRLSSSSRVRVQNAPDSPLTPVPENQVPHRPATGTPAPWAPRLSVLARIPAGNKVNKNAEVDPTKPVFVGDFPPAVRDEQASFLQSRLPGYVRTSGGIDHATSLTWIICQNKIFIWNYSSPATVKKCIALNIPTVISEVGDKNRKLYDRTDWLVCVVNWDGTHHQNNNVTQHCNSAGIVMCSKRSRAVVYWPEIFSDCETDPIISFASSDELDVSPVDDKASPDSLQQHGGLGNISAGYGIFNSLIATSIPDSKKECVALACSSSGELWQFHCGPSVINRKLMYKEMGSSFSQGSDIGHSTSRKVALRSLSWRSPSVSLKRSSQQFFLLTDHEIHCFNLGLDLEVSNLWSQEIVGNDGDVGIKKDLAGQKRIWPLDLQVDDGGKVITILVAIFCKDRVSGSSYTQYSLLTMQYKSGIDVPSGAMEPLQERVLEKKAPLQVIIPKARVEDDDFLFSMRLRVGGRPSGSAVILSGDGTATVSHYYRNSTRLYQFDLPHDAGKVLDASVLPSTDDCEEGAWIVLTEKAGMWAIPEKAVVLGGVEPPERSLSRKGSSNEGSTEEERRNLTFAGNVAPRRASSEAWNAGDRQRAVMTGIARRTAQDEEAEALLGHLFNDFLMSGKVDGSLEKLQNAGAFEREGEMNVFVRASKCIVDTLAKHWTTTRGAEIVAMAVVSTQLMDKQQKHLKFLQFLALSKSHDELCARQRNSLQIILEHGEKLAGIIQLRELQNRIGQNRSSGVGSPFPGSESDASGALWDLIQLVGDRARRNTVLLMDRDNAEVFYSRVSDLQEVFYCLEKQLDFLVNVDVPLEIQIRRASELSNACVTIVRTAIQFRSEYHLWYPPPEGLTPWYCEPVVRNGLWGIASCVLHLLNEATRVESSVKSEIFTHLQVMTEVLLEAYAGAITAKVERGEEQRGLLQEYWSRRDTLLDSLYEQMKNLAAARHKDLNEGNGQENEENFQNLSAQLLGVAKRHEGYRTLWSICHDLNDFGLLKNLMRDSMGPKGGFSYFVFEQLYEKKEFAKLLRLGEEFPEELSIFLQQYRDLCWLHEVFLHRFSSASDTLHALGLSQDEGNITVVEDGVEPRDLNLTLSDRKRFLNLSKIAALAGGNDPDAEIKIKRIEADLRILKLQEEIMDLDIEAKQNIGQQLLPPDDLIKWCLKSGSPELILRSFDIFAWTSSSFRRFHKSLLEECWKSAADQDDWGKLHQASTIEGWSDEETLRVLRDTMLFQASSRCYGPEAETFEEGFEEVLPLRQENMEPSVLKESGSSVEAILMQHKYFPDAGKLMLMAIELGSVRSRTNCEEGPLPME